MMLSRVSRMIKDSGIQVRLQTWTKKEMRIGRAELRGKQELVAEKRCRR